MKKTLLLPFLLLLAIHVSGQVTTENIFGDFQFGTRYTLFNVPYFAEQNYAFEVTTTADNGVGSLRWAIDQVNANNANLDKPRLIYFNIPSAAPHIIMLSSPLPVINKGAFIDGFLQPANGYTGSSPKIILSGSNFYNNASIDISNRYGLRFNPGEDHLFTPQIHVQGLEFRNFAGVAIQVDASLNTTIVGNIIIDDAGSSSTQPYMRIVSIEPKIYGNILGTDLSGRKPSTIRYQGMHIYGHSHIRIGSFSAIEELARDEANIVGNTEEGGIVADYWDRLTDSGGEF